MKACCPLLRVLSLTALFLLTFSPVAGAEQITLWAVDESGPSVDGVRQSPRLIAFTDYTSTLSSYIDFGRMVWDDGGTIRNFAGSSETNAEAMAVDSRTGVAWFIINEASGGFSEAHLFTLDLSTINPASQVVLTHVGALTGYGAVEGMAFNEVTRQLYGVAASENGSSAEDLVLINSLTGAATFIGDLQGTISGTGQQVSQTDGLEFVHTYDGFGNVLTATAFAYDQTDNHLYQVDVSNATLTALINSGAGSGTDIETIAWDHINGRMIALDNSNDAILSLSLMGNNAVVTHTTYDDQELYSGADLEGSGFYSRAAVVPEPSGALLMGVCGLVLLVRRRRLLG